MEMNESGKPLDVRKKRQKKEEEEQVEKANNENCEDENETIDWSCTWWRSQAKFFQSHNANLNLLFNLRTLPSK